MQKHEPGKSMIFTNTRRQAEKVWLSLKGNNIKAGLLTGDVPQKKRIRLLEELKTGSIDVLIATDVAARGLHISGVSHVFNFDLPDDAEDYVHRIGRTARAGAEGDAISFAGEDNAFNLPAIEEYIDSAIPTAEVTPDLLADIMPPAPAERKRPPHRRSNNRPNRGGNRGPRRGKPNSGNQSGKSNSGNNA